MKTLLIEKIGKIFRTDPKYLLNGIFHLSVGQIIVSTSGFILTLGLVNFLNQVDYGLYSYIISIASILTIFTLPGVDTAVTQSISRGFDNIIVQSFWIKLRWGSLATIVAFIFSFYYLYNNNLILGVSLLIIGIFTPIIYACTLYVSYFIGKQQFKKITKDNIFKNVTITLGILFVTYLTQSVIYTILAYFVLNALISAIRFFLLFKQINNDIKDSGQHLSLGKHLSVMEALSLLASHIDKVIIFQTLGATQLAIYALALAPVKQLQNISKTLRTLLLPKFANRSLAELEKTLWYRTGIIFIFSVLIILAYCFTAPYIFRLVFPVYTESVLYTQVLSTVLLFVPLVLHIQILTAHHMKGELYAINIAKAISKIIFLIILTPLFGLWGVIFSFIGSQAVSSIFIIFLLERACRNQMKL